MSNGILKINFLNHCSFYFSIKETDEILLDSSKDENRELVELNDDDKLNKANYFTIWTKTKTTLTATVFYTNTETTISFSFLCTSDAQFPTTPC